MKYLTKDDIISAKDCDVVPYEIPEWKGSIYIKKLSGADFDKFTSSIDLKDEASTKNVMECKLVLLGMAICDSEGERLFADKELAELNKKNNDVLMRLFSLVSEMNSTSLGNVEQAEKN